MKKFFIRISNKCEDTPDNFNLPNDLFNNPSIESIGFFFLKARKLPKHLLRGCRNLRKFVFQSGKLEEIELELFLPTKNISHIDFANNDITSIAAETFQGFTHLTTLRLLMNKLSEVTEDLFRGTTNIKKLELQVNRISIFNTAIITTLTRLEEINLSDNLLTTTILSKDHQHSNLRKILLTNNKISQIDFEILADMKNLESVDMSYNLVSDYLKLDSKLSVRTSLTVNLSYNNIRGVKLRQEQQLHGDKRMILQLAGNPLRCIL